MCTTCGCNSTNEDAQIYRPGEEPVRFTIHSHGDGVPHVHIHSHTHSSETHSVGVPNEHISIEQDILNANNRMAERNRGYFEAKEIFVINMVSSPGSGKTSLLEATLKMLTSSVKCYVIEGDQHTDNDAQRIQKQQVEVIQINTGNSCHLDAHMIYKAVHNLSPVERSFLFIENVGNLVCPSLFDLGENLRLVIFSVTEGEDKPLKYPYIFHSSQIVVINKIDLLPYLDFDMNKAKNYIKQINSHATIFELSVKTGSGMDKWINWLKEKRKLQ